MQNAGLESLSAVLARQYGQDRTRPRPLPTGFPRLDALLGGGLSPGLTVLGGSPGLGKSTFALQLAAGAAERGVPVLYFSLEMSGARLAAKALSRRMFLAGPPQREGITAAQLYNGEARPTEEAWQAVRRGLERLYVIDTVLPAAEIARTAGDFRDRGETPLVIVDYLQILPAPRGSSEKQQVEESLKQLSRLAHGGFPVLLISSLNRSSYNGSMQLDAFKESGGIEYSADVLLGLQFCACRGRGGWDPNAERNKFPRQVEIAVLKQRYGLSGGTVRFRYYAEFDCFQETEEGDAAGLPERRGPLFVMNNTKLCNEIRSGRAPVGEAVSCRVFEETVTRCRLSGSLSPFDCDVADAVYTLLLRRQKSFSPGDVLRVLSGDARQTITRQKRQVITASLERLRNVEIAIDCTAEMRARGKLGLEETRELSGPFLSAVPEEGRYVFPKDVLPLPLYTYGELTTQMISFPQCLLEVRAGGRRLSNTEGNICLKRYLIRRLEVIRNRRSKAGPAMRSLSFQEGSGLMTALGFAGRSYQTEAAREARRKALAKTAMDVLEYYRRLGYLTGFTPRSDGVTITGEVRDPWQL
ncbi:MAG: AAA family ATPase [Oscillibacter sp.]|nr:AAA family ATPase [Oscillibacter sp.]